MGAGLTRATSRVGKDEEEADEDPDLDLNVPVNVKNIFVDGLSQSKTQLITNQLGRLFEAKTFKTLMNDSNACRFKLQRLGIFKNIHVFIDVADTGNPHDYDIFFKVDEARRLRAYPSATFDQVGGLDGILFGGKMCNIYGTGDMFKLQSSYGRKVASSVEFSYTKPSMEDSDKVFSVHGVKSTTDFVTSAFKEKKHGLKASYTMPGSLGMHTVGFDVNWRENFIDAYGPFEIREQCGHSLKSAVWHSLVSDGRDDWVFPTEGHLFRHTVEYSGLGGNVNLIKTDVEVQLNKLIFNDFVLSGSFRAGGLRPLTKDPVFINDRYFLGGPMSIRGYTSRGIGQHADNASLGGDMFWESGVHLYTPLPFRPGFGDGSFMNFFVNAGNLENLGNVRPKEFLSNARCSYGLGMVMMFGSARIELNYCIPVNARASDITNKGLQIGIGLAFL